MVRKTRRSHRDAVLDEVRQYGVDGRFRSLNNFSPEDLEFLIVVGKRIAESDDNRWTCRVKALQLVFDAVTEERVESVRALSGEAHARVRLAVADAWIGEEPIS